MISPNTRNLTIFYEDAGLDSKVKLLTAKVLYSKAGIELPIEVLEKEHFYDTKQIVSMLKVFGRVMILGVELSISII